MNLPILAKELIEKSKAATTRCCTCASPAWVYSSREGTNSYETVVTEAQDIQRLAEAFLSAVEILSNHSKFAWTEQGDYCGGSCDEVTDWLAKFGEVK